jgi:hypothetical protein
MSFHVPNQYRVRNGHLASDDSIGCNGMFVIPNTIGTAKGLKWAALRVIAGDGLGWEHVSVSLPNRCPKWLEMDYIKGLFWDDTDCVMQLHPPRAEWVNNHPFCLHLWRPIGIEIPRPPSIMVGDKSKGVLK